MDDRVVITLFRHGLTLDNKRKAFLGWNDSPLCEEAIEQLSTYDFNPSSYDLFVTSDLRRCVETMKRLFPQVTPKMMSHFREMSFGFYEGKTYEQLKDDPHFQKFFNAPFRVTPKDGESFQQFSERVDHGWKKLVEVVLETGKTKPFVVTHGGVIRYLLTKFAPYEKEFWDWDVPHGKGYELHFKESQLRRGERCTLLQVVPSMENERG